MAIQVKAKGGGNQFCSRLILSAYYDERVSQIIYKYLHTLEFCGAIIEHDFNKHILKLDFVTF